MKNIYKVLKMLEKKKKGRFLMTLGETSIKKKQTRKVDINEYEEVAECIKMDQVPASEIAEIFTDKYFYRWYKKNYLTDK